MTTPNLEIPNLTDSQRLYKGLVENLIGLNTLVSTLDSQTKDLRKTVYGNGEAGLDEVVREHGRFIRSLKKGAWILFGAILAQTITFGTAVIIAYIKFLPVLERLAANQP